MIVEFFKTFFSDAPRWAKKQKLVQESIAIGARYERQKEHWSSHLQNSCTEVLKFKENHPHAKKIAVFGSGHLLDFPAELLDQTDIEIFLFDAVHPLAVKQKKTRAKCHFIYADLNLRASEILQEQLWALSQCEIFISLNLLSQLALCGTSREQESAREERAQTLIENHLQFLKDLARPVLLISDFEKRFLSPQGAIEYSGSSLFNYKMKPSLRQWLWDLAPVGEVSRAYRIELNVGVWLI